jgi:Domain of Unknown Function (DUF1080)
METTMNHSLTRRAGLVGATLLLAACSGMPGASGWTTLVDGAKGLENFEQLGDANWRAEGDAIVADKAKVGSFLVSKKSYKDFELRAEFWADHHTNSGIFLRLSDPKVVTSANSYEVNIYDQRPDPVYGTGAIVDFAKVTPMPKAGGKWNTYVVTARGTSVVVVFNGVQTVHMTDKTFASGPVALQFGNGPKDAPGGAIKWRKVQIMEL